MRHTLSQGLRIGVYEITRFVAYGGMSEVYEAKHIGLDKRLAVKLMKPEYAKLPENRRRFFAEGMAAARIDHTHVVDVSDYGMLEEVPYLVMAYLEGDDLGTLFEQQAPLPASELVDYLLPVVSAVAAAHAQGVVHRDLKPENIFLHREGPRIIPKVLDFGISRVEGSRQTHDRGICGTPQYMSPERARGDSVDASCDQYSIGVILYEGLTGQAPWDAEDPYEVLRKVATEPCVAPSHYVAMPAELEAVILRAMAHEPSQRFDSMAALGQALLPFASARAATFWGQEFAAPAPDPRAGEAASRAPCAPPVMAVPPPAASLPKAAGTHDLETSDEQRTARDYALLRRRGHGGGGALRIAAVALALAALAWLGGLGHLGDGEPPATAESAATEPPSYAVDVAVSPSTATLALDGRHAATGRFATRLPVDGTRHELVVAADGFQTRRLTFTDAAPPARVELATLAASAPEAAAPDARAARPGAPKAARPRARRSNRGDEQREAASTRRSASAGARVERDAVANPPSIADIDAERIPEVAVVEPRSPRVRLIDDLDVNARQVE